MADVLAEICALKQAAVAKRRAEYHKTMHELKTDASFVTCVSTVGDALGALERQLQG